jgi:hypothetical protein
MRISALIGFFSPAPLAPEPQYAVVFAPPHDVAQNRIMACAVPNLHRQMPALPNKNKI